MGKLPSGCARPGPGCRPEHVVVLLLQCLGGRPAELRVDPGGVGGVVFGNLGQVKQDAVVSGQIGGIKICRHLHGGGDGQDNKSYPGQEHQTVTPRFAVFHMPR